MLAETLINQIRDQLHVTSDVRWTLNEKIRALNFAQKLVVILRPDANAKNLSVELDVSDTKQSIPTGGIRFLKLTRNTGVDGDTPGKGITLVDFDAMTLENIDWHTDAAAASPSVEHFLYDNTNPLNFYVYPQTHGTTAQWVEIIYSKEPTPVPEDDVYDPLTDVIGVPDIYEPVLFDFVAHRLYLKDEEAGSAQSAAMHFQSAYQLLGVKSQKDTLFNPSLREGRHNERAPRIESEAV